MVRGAAKLKIGTAQGLEIGAVDELKVLPGQCALHPGNLPIRKPESRLSVQRSGTGAQDQGVDPDAVFAESPLEGDILEAEAQARQIGPGFGKFQGPAQDRLFPGTHGRQVPLHFPATGADGLGKERGDQTALLKFSGQAGLHSTGRAHLQGKSGGRGRLKSPEACP